MKITWNASKKYEELFIQKEEQKRRSEKDRLKRKEKKKQEISIHPPNKRQLLKTALSHLFSLSHSENPSGLLLTGFSALFLAAIPLTSYITQPNSIFEKSLNGLTSTLTHLIPSSSPTTTTSTNKIATLATLYLTVTYALSGAASAAGINSAYAEGRDNNYPRKQVVGLKEGLPLRLYSAHYHLMEMFPGWAVVAALAQGIAPHDQGVVNLLGLHVVVKCFV